jgi:hypothetical protein
MIYLLIEFQLKNQEKRKRPEILLTFAFFSEIKPLVEFHNLHDVEKWHVAVSYC